MLTHVLASVAPMAVLVDSVERLMHLSTANC